MAPVKLTALAFVALIAMIPVSVEAGQAAKRTPEEVLRFESFGAVHTYRQSSHPANVVIFFSGEAGWDQRAAGMARALASLDSLVVGIDVPRYLRSLAEDGEECSYYASDLEDLSHYVQRKLGFPGYVFPIVAGYSAGAALAYASLVQGPTGTLRGGISLAFCPGLRLPKMPCRASGLESKKLAQGRGAKWDQYVLQPAPALAVPWIVLEADADRACAYEAAEAFVRQTGQARIVKLATRGQGASAWTSWIPQIQEEYSSLLRTLEARSAAPKAPDVKDLPLVEMPVPGSSSDMLAVVISGDGGWAGIDRGIGRELSSNGISVVGLNSLQYFWKRRTPDTAAADLNRILRHYLTAWKKGKAILAGYSMGADVLPFMAARLPSDLLSRVNLVALLGPSATIDFEFHFASWFGGAARKTDLPVAPEVEKLRGKDILCIYGVEEEDTLCKVLPAGLVQPIAMKDGHHYGGDYKSVAEVILKMAR